MLRWVRLAFESSVTMGLQFAYLAFHAAEKVSYFLPNSLNTLIGIHVGPSPLVLFFSHKLFRLFQRRERLKMATALLDPRLDCSYSLLKRELSIVEADGSVRKPLWFSCASP